MADWDSDFGEVLDAAAARIEAVLPIALAKAAEHVRGEAAKLTPIETGHLVGSAEVRVHQDGALPWAEIYYPGPYARYQHYELQLRHTHGQALYLEQPMITETQKVVQIIAGEIRDVL